MSKARIQIALTCLLTVGAFLQTASAQAVPQGEAFAGYSFINIDTNRLTSRQNANGWEGSVSGNFNRWFAIEGDVSGYYKTYDISGLKVAVEDYSYGAGPRFNFKPLFVHALFGGDHLSGAALGESAAQDSIAGAIGGGVAWKLSRRLGIRTSADYVFTRHNILGGPSVTQNNVRASVGLVYSFGEKEKAGTEPTRAATESGMAIPVLGIRVVSAVDNRGAQIIQVIPNSIADFAGFHTDDVIDLIDGKPIHTAMELEAALEQYQPGSQIKVGVMLSGAWQSGLVVVLK